MGSGASVLVVFNDDTMQRLLLENLTPRYTVYVSATWPQALEVVAGHEVQIVVADARLAFTASEGLEDLRGRIENVPVLFVTQPADTSLERDAGHVRRPLFVGKP